MSTDVRISSGLCLWLIVAGAASPSAAQNSADALQLAELLAQRQSGQRGHAPDVGTKPKAMDLAQSYLTRSGWETEARKRASDVASAIQRTLK